MKKLVVMLCLGLMVFSINAQEKTKKQKLTRAEKRELRQQQEEATKQVVASIIEARQFVLEANVIKNKRGDSFPVNSSINFVKVDSAIAIFQFGSAHTIGINGVGGVTVEGRINTFEVHKREKSGSYYIRIGIAAPSGFYDIQLSISSVGTTEAQVTALSNNRINYSGKIVPISQSHIYKGSSY